MPHLTPSTIANEGSHPLPDSNRTLVCPSCGDTMRHLRTVPKIGVRQEKLIFVCPSCKKVDTKEIRSTRHSEFSFRATLCFALDTTDTLSMAGNGLL
jgi:protein-arginine kinase activator protein McsA